jgi:two-component system, OmpR family, sensor kinase
MRRWRERRLHHQLFAWMALTILASVAISAVVLSAFHPGKTPFGLQPDRVSAFAAGRFAERWDDAAAREALAREAAEAFDARLELFDASGRTLSVSGASECRGPSHVLDVSRSGEPLGHVEICVHGLRRFRPAVALAVLGTMCLVLWTAAAILSRRMTRPLSLLIAATREIGKGNLSARVRLGRHQHGELRHLAESVNEMAERIERQLEDQRELLAAVSHEVRSPLARLRLGAEILRADPGNAAALDSIELEVVELDGLVGNLLASSRLDFKTLSRQDVDLAELCRQVVARHQLRPEACFEDATPAAVADVDPTLVARALDNLLDNAARHGGGVVACRLERSTASARAFVVEVRDAGPGFPREVLPRVFDAFYRGPGGASDRSGSLGLGLALVRRIARAHGGEAWAENLPGGGARVAFSIGAAPGVSRT